MLFEQPFVLGAAAFLSARLLSPSVGVLMLGWLLWRRCGTPLARIPGPLLASFTSLWKYRVVCQSEMPWTNADLHEKYGPLVRIGPSHVSASSPEAIDVIYVDSKGFQKSEIYGIFQPYWEGSPLHNIFSTQDAAYHTLLKRKVGHLYSMSNVVEMESNIDIALNAFIAKLRGFARDDPALVDMSAWLQYYTFDAQAQINFSSPIGFLESGTDVGGFCHLDHEMMVYFAQWGQIPSTERLVSKLRSLVSKQGENPLYTFVLDKINQRFEKPTSDPDFMNAMIRTNQKHPDTISMREVIGAVYINIVTGHDVTAIQLRALAYYIARTPHVYRKIRDEIRKTVDVGKVSSPAQYSEISQSTYLTAVVQETLRIHPSAGLILERVVPAEGVVLHGKYLPGGTKVGVNAWAINRNKEIFGNDIESFRPERWIEEEPEKLKLMRKAMFTFGAGTRGCIGKNMAMLQLYKVVFELFRNFDVEWPDDETSWSVVGGWLTRQTEMSMRLTRREAS